ncbi:uncharacterized protein GGS22DRAFT_20972 [Annulohypoxylon maeteangense]|uniref:uncharacterized protein n=1 Tax=Annulohypoxylon maeteangense TaxID=1927788 RepID=UPI002007ECFD|nr:uncharacterized protein GGS22DRAFT_20972 [Annulohypoxylon maeteangense]KAI0884238.1 hypothetical protein GGS22DRAFT_20972 [Annulohypoxylon maeteangense]
MDDISSTPIPVVLCGKAEVVGRQVVEGLKPEIDVLRGLAPPTQSSYIGSGLYATLPKAVIMGAAWDADDVALVKAAIESVGLPASAAPVILRNDTSVPTPQPPAREYGEQLMRRIRSTVGKLVRGEKLSGPEEGVVWY